MSQVLEVFLVEKTLEELIGLSAPNELIFVVFEHHFDLLVLLLLV